MAYADHDPRRAIALFEEAIAVEAGVGAYVSSWASAYLALLHAEDGNPSLCLSTARAGIVAVSEETNLVMLVQSVDYAGVALSLLGLHEPAAALYGIVDSGVVGSVTLTQLGWLADARSRGRALTRDALGPEAIGRHAEHFAGMNISDVVAHAVGALDGLLAELDD
jgi:hypothetical protein